MKYIKIILLIIVFINIHKVSFSKEIYFVDLKRVLNESKAGKKAQSFLKKKFDTENKKFEKEGQAIKKKVISAEEYKTSLNSLRERNISYQKKQRTASNEWVNKKNEARNKLLEALTPIMKKYMEDNNVEIIVDKKYILLANSDFEITDKILKILDDELKSIDLN